MEVTEDTPDRKPWLTTSEESKINKILDLHQVALDWTLYWCIRKFAAELIQLGSPNGVGALQNNPYVSTGAFFYGLPNAAVGDLYLMQTGFDTDYLEWVASVDMISNVRLKNLTTLAFLLARAEGLPEIEPKVLMQALPNLCLLLQLEHKYRQGLVTVDYKQYSLFDADKHRPLQGVVKKQQPK